MPSIDINEFIDNRIYRCRFYPPLEVRGHAATLKDAISAGLDYKPFVTGFITNPMGWSASNTWEGLHGGMQAEKDQEKLIKATEAFKSYAGSTGGQSAVQGITETIARYAGSQKPSFSFNIMLVALNPGDNILKACLTFLKGCYPKSAKWGLMEAPYGYNTGIDADSDAYGSGVDLTDRSKVRGLWHVTVGQWFNCPELVLDSCNVNFSQQCTPDGQPLFAEIQLAFSTWRLITANELAAFFNM